MAKKGAEGAEKRQERGCDQRLKNGAGHTRLPIKRLAPTSSACLLLDDLLTRIGLP